MFAATKDAVHFPAHVVLHALHAHVGSVSFPQPVVSTSATD